ncbi:hypothetical protein ACFSL4_35705 [Streptomyces caeni]|uniref:Uncharacterized protein n=1 Tax=Streptomyces caeni TaxID=2307231 RepID=A0ABW4J3D5_9ACTN
MRLRTRAVDALHTGQTGNTVHAVDAASARRTARAGLTYAQLPDN